MHSRIIIHQTSYDTAHRLATETLALFAKSHGHYTNSLNSHLRGKIGELACADWLSEKGVHCERVFEVITRIAEADLVTRILRLDVKTWDERYWHEMGRCVAVAQLATLKSKADAVLWCVTPQTLGPGIAVVIVGWNTLDDVATAQRCWTGPAGKRQVYNYQVELSAVRPLDELVNRTAS